jgi:dihydroflavonol-4-reductase
MKTAFVTGATGLLGNNLVRALVRRGVKVRALVRSREKAIRQFGPLEIDLVEGDMLNISRFAHALNGNDVLFHTAAFFREAYQGVSDWSPILRVNVEGTVNLFEAAYAAGVRRFVHTSSVAVLGADPNGKPVDESFLRQETDGDEYYRSKIQSDQRVLAFLERHKDANATMVLPGWMFGPGDLGPTAAGQFILDFVGRKLPGVLNVGYSVVDARDVAEAMIAAAEKGRRGERYLAAGRRMSMTEIAGALSEVTGVPAPKTRVPIFFVYIIAAFNEVYARITRRPTLLNLAIVKNIMWERQRSGFKQDKIEQELGIKFRPVIETFHDTFDWLRENQGMVSTGEKPTTGTNLATSHRV